MLLPPVAAAVVVVVVVIATVNVATMAPHNTIVFKSQI